MKLTSEEKEVTCDYGRLFLQITLTILTLGFGGLNILGTLVILRNL